MTLAQNFYLIAFVFVAVETFVALRMCQQKKANKKHTPQMSPDEVLKQDRELHDYVRSPKSNPELGLMYERYIGYLLETQGYSVQFSGALKGSQDQGCDLVAKKGKETLIIQTNFAAKSKVIREKHVNQIYESTEHYRLTHPNEKNVKAVLYSTTNLSLDASDIAILLEVDFHKVPYDKYYPMIKCCVLQNGERIFHLPWDESYDKVNIDLKKDEFYARTVNEAVANSFRRATKHKAKRAA